MADTVREILEFGGLFNSLAESKTPKNRCYAMSNCSVERDQLQARPGYSLFGQRSSPNSGDLGWGFAYGKYSNDEVQTIVVTGAPTGGTFTLTWNGQTTASLAYNATAAQIQAALEDLSNILIGDVVVQGGPLPNAQVTVTFRGQYANTDVALMTKSTSYSGGSTPAMTISETVKGGTAEEYLAVVQKNGDSTATLYTVDASSGTFTQVATNLNASDWYFTQYGNKIYGVNAVQGMFVKTIGTSTGASTAFTRPAPPTLPPSAAILGNSLTGVSATGLSAGTYSGWGSNPTATILSSGTIRLSLNAALSANSEVSFQYEWSSDQNFERADLWALNISASKAMNLNNGAHLFTAVQFIDNASATYTPPVYGTSQTQQTGALGRLFHWQGEQRAGRKITRKIKITFKPDISLASGDVIAVQLLTGSQWPNDVAPINVDASPVSKSIEYAYSYYDAATGLESDLSPVRVTAVLPPSTNKWGAYANLTLTVSSSLTSSDKIYLYRREKETGEMRRLPNLDGTMGLANTGTPTFADPYIESELAAFSKFGEGQVGLAASQIAGVAVQICVWKQSLIVAARRQAFESWTGQPTHFEPSPDDAKPKQAEDREDSEGRTDYVSDNRSEEVLGIHGQDSLYAATPLSSYAMVGDLPSSAAPFRRLPGSRGAVGSRSTFILGGGFEVPSQDGLWYYSVGRGFSGEDNGALVEREETSEVRQSWSDLAAASGCVGIEHEGAIWIWQGANYLCYTRSNKWISGAFADSVKAAVANRVRGLKFMDSKGRIFTISASYTTDNGTAIAWEYSTGWLTSQRIQLKQIEIQGDGECTVSVYLFDGANTVASPLTFTRSAGRVFVSNFSVPPATRYKLKFSGASASVNIQDVALHFEKAPGGWNN